jgi:hypothetical protein
MKIIEPHFENTNDLKINTVFFNFLIASIDEFASSNTTPFKSGQ